MTTQKKSTNYPQTSLTMRIVRLLLVVVVLFATYVGYVYGSSYIAQRRYQPVEGDVVFQSLPHSELVDAIEGVTQSPYSHCGIVVKKDGQWGVCEAYGGVEITPLRQFLSRGRDQGFAVYRLEEKYRLNIPKTIDELEKYLGLPYDIKYELDDEKIYCSELIYKAYRDATNGEQLGKLVRFGDMNWGQFEDTIRYIEKGPVPVDREMITPRNLADANQLELVYSYSIVTKIPKP